MPDRGLEKEADQKHEAAFDLQSKGQFEEAVKKYKSALDWCNGKFRRDDPLVIDCLSGLARCLHEAKNYSDAITVDRELLRHLKRKDGANESKETIEIQQDLADALHNTGDYLEAASLNRRSLIAWRIFDSQKERVHDSYETITVRDHLAGNYHELGKYMEAARLYETNYAVRKLDFKEDHDDILITRHNLALNLVALEDLRSLSRAQELHKENLAVLKHSKKREKLQISWVERGLRICGELIAEKLKTNESSLSVHENNKAPKHDKRDSSRPRSTSSLKVKIHNPESNLRRSKSQTEKNRKQPASEPQGSQKRDTSTGEKSIDISNKPKITTEKTASDGRNQSPNEGAKKDEKTRMKTDSTKKSENSESRTLSTSGNGKSASTKPSIETISSKTEKRATAPNSTKRHTELYKGSEMQMALHDRGEIIMEKASARIRGTQEKGKKDVKLGNEELAVLAPRQKRMQQSARSDTPTSSGKDNLPTSDSHRSSKSLAPVIVINRNDTSSSKSPKRHGKTNPYSPAPNLSPSKGQTSPKSTSELVNKPVKTSNSNRTSTKQLNGPENSGYEFSKLFEIRSNPDREQKEAANKWFEDFFSQTKSFIGEPKKNGRIKIAILDSGFDQEHPDFQRDDVKSHIRKWKSFVEGHSSSDFQGHGTHVLSVLLKVAPFADFYIACVVNKDTEKIKPENVAEAIKYATQEWGVSIVTMSFGFSSWQKSIAKAIDEANPSPEDPDARRVLFFAAAANHGNNDGIAFPASRNDVFCIGSTDGRGDIKGYTPVSLGGTNSFSVLGAGVRGAWPISLKDGSHRYLSGTSFATPIAAGIAALVLEFERQNRPKKIKHRERLRDFEGMSLVFRELMAKQKGEKDYYYLLPWKLFDPKMSDELMDAASWAARNISMTLAKKFDEKKT